MCNCFYIYKYIYTNFCIYSVVNDDDEQNINDIEKNKDNIVIGHKEINVPIVYLFDDFPYIVMTKRIVEEKKI